MIASIKQSLRVNDMKNLFYPYNYVNSVFEIDFQRLCNIGFKAVIFDIDNTLVYQDENSNESVKALFEYIHSLGLKTFILSNNSEARVKPFAQSVNSLYLSRACKPFKFGYRKALKMLGAANVEAVFIGDRVTTDIFGANRSGIASILVKYISPADVKILKNVRRLESIILKCYENNKNLQNRLGNIIKENI